MSPTRKQLRDALVANLRELRNAGVDVTMAVIEGGSSTANQANVTSTYDLQVNLPTTPNVAGFAAMVSQVDDGTVTGTKLARALEASEDFRLRVGVDTPMFFQTFEGTVVATDRLQQTATSMTAAQSSGFLTLNSGSSTTTTQGVLYRT